MDNTIWSGLRGDERYLTKQERDTAWLFLFMYDYCFLPCMIIVSFHACGLRWSICFLQSRWGSQGWQFLFLSRGFRMVGREESCLIFVNCFLPCMIIVSFHACGLRWTICFLQSRRGSQGWQFFFYRTAGREERPQKKVAQKNSLTFVLFSCRILIFIIHN